MAFAGLWERWNGPKGNLLPEPLLSFSIATAAANATVAPFHNRMPVVLTRSAEWDSWLDPEAAPAGLLRLLVPAPDDLLEEVTVTRDLLRIKEPGPDVLSPAR